MHRLLVLLVCFLVVVYAGPGTHRYQQPHSNYGDKQHVLEHMKEQPAPEMSEQDMIYYLFVIHDVNGDGYLDGHELLAAFSDVEDEQVAEFSLEEVTVMVDHVLLEDDKNGDGLISWSEYLESQLYHE